MYYISLYITMLFRNETIVSLIDINYSKLKKKSKKYQL